MTEQEQEFDIRNVKAEMQEEYKELTGEDLPDHVVENYDEFVTASPSVEDMRQAVSYGRKAERAESGTYSATQLGATAVVMAVVGAAVGSVVIGTIVAAFGTVVATVVGIMFGFALGVLLR